VRNDKNKPTRSIVHWQTGRPLQQPGGGGAAIQFESRSQTVERFCQGE
jgi:hypothetical protein